MFTIFQKIKSLIPSPFPLKFFHVNQNISGTDERRLKAKRFAKKMKYNDYDLVHIPVTSLRYLKLKRDESDMKGGKTKEKSCT